MKRGELWWELLEPTTELQTTGHRPVVVSSSDWWNDARPPMVAVVPISLSLGATPNQIDVPAGMGGLTNEAALLPEHLRFVDCRRLTAPIGGELSSEIMDRLRDALLRAL